MKIKQLAVAVKAGPDDGLSEGEFIVYPSTFTKEPDAYGDIVAPGAFLDTIAEWEASGNVLPGLYGHRLDDPDYFVAGASEMTEDEHGWRVRGAFDMESPKGPQVYRLVKGKKLAQLSFAYDVLDEGQIELPDGRKVNELRKLKVYEFSFVPIGANQDTSVVAVKELARELASKAGRVISAKNESALRTALEGLEASAAQIKDVLAQLGRDEEDQKKAAEAGEVKDEGGDVKSEDPPGSSPARALAVNQFIQSL